MRSEREKMLAGELYSGNDPELVKMRNHARKLFTQFNQLPYHQVHQKRELLEQLFGKLGKNTEIQAPLFVDYGCHIFAGDNLFMNFNCVILDCAKVNIGNNVGFGPGVHIYTAYHPMQAEERLKGPEYAGPVTIEDNVWVGGGAIICQHVTIGQNTTIGAGSVVTRPVPPNVFAAGNPCKVIRKL